MRSRRATCSKSDVLRWRLERKKTLSKSKICRKLLCISQEKQKRTEYKEKINVLFKLLFTAYPWLWVNSLSVFPHSGFCCLSLYNTELWKAKDKQWQHRHSCEMQMEIWVHNEASLCLDIQYSAEIIYWLHLPFQVGLIHWMLTLDSHSAWFLHCTVMWNITFH